VSLPSAPIVTSGGYDQVNPVDFRREMLVADGTVLRAVVSRAAMTAGTFYVEDSAGSSPGQAPVAIYAWLRAGDSPSAHTMEAATRSELFNPGNASYFRVIGFTLRYASNKYHDGALSAGNTGSLIEENTIQWANAAGISLHGDHHVYRGNHADDNGQIGFAGGCNDCVIEYGEAMRNNWKDYSPGWDAGGIKSAGGVTGITIRAVSVGDNNGNGIWFDAGPNTGNRVERCVSFGNVQQGLRLENNTSATVVVNNVFWHNGGAGVATNASSQNVIAFNTFIANGSGLNIVYNNRGPSEQYSVYDNVFYQDTGGEIAISGGPGTQNDPSTNRFDGNVYFNTTGSRIFHVRYDGSDPRSYTGSRLTAWRAAIGSDAHSSIADPMLANPAVTGGWHLLAGSPAIGAAIALPRGDAPVLEDIEQDVRPASGADVGADQRTSAGARGSACGT
jgi:hypothetical protein